MYIIIFLIIAGVLIAAFAVIGKRITRAETNTKNSIEIVSDVKLANSYASLGDILIWEKKQLDVQTHKEPCDE